jgi:hypothetical protein
MATDPAVLLYTSDFLTGTMFMTNEQLGKYTRLLFAQHQKWELSEKDMMKICETYDEDIFCKFVKTDAGTYYNARMRMETLKRKKYCESRSKNRKSTTHEEHVNEISLTHDDHMNNISSSHEEHMSKTCKSHVQHMENENENEIRNTNEIEGGVGETKSVQPPKQKFKSLELFAQMVEIYDQFIRKRTDMPAKLDATQGKAMNVIIKYLTTASKEKTDEGILKSWSRILDNWNQLSSFNQNRLNLTEISSSITNILSEIKNGAKTTDPTSTGKTLKSTTVVNNGKSFGRL